MKAIWKKIKRWFSARKRKKAHHFFDDAPYNYMPCLPMSSHDKAVYKLKVSGDTETLVSTELKSGDKKRKKAKVREL